MSRNRSECLEEQRPFRLHTHLLHLLRDPVSFASNEVLQNFGTAELRGCGLIQKIQREAQDDQRLCMSRIAPEPRLESRVLERQGCR